MKRVLRYVAGIALIAALLVLLSLEGQRQLTKPAAAQPLPVVEVDLRSMLRYKSEVFPLLLCALEPGASDALEPSLLYLLTIEEGVVADAINIPVDTRVAASPGGPPDDCTPRQAYVEGAAHGKGEEQLLQAVRGLFYSVPIERIVALRMEDVGHIIEGVGGVYIAGGDFYAQAAGELGFANDAPAGRESFISTGARARAYVAYSGTGTDSAALARQNNMFAALIDRIAQKQLDYIDVLAFCEGEVVHNLSAQERDALVGALENTSYYRMTSEALRILEGSERLMENQSWLPDHSAIKRYVLDRFYEARVDERPAVAGAIPIAAPQCYPAGVSQGRNGYRSDRVPLL